eukprot:TRINITY_DN71425_c0_g1_i1.p1 TRINITY_DN71425_c0_g1~~TRINITY_DN71425_c0_g1_i1.p1  ORF type:complete len:432 (-),score=108.20 TRINITY_DN71425_c0_g1_i1:170-1465(-)
MPRAGRSRKKKRTEKEVDVAEKEKQRTPRCFILKQGKIGDRVRDLVKDFRQVMMPNTAKNLRESKLNRIEDFIAVASHFNVSHIMMFSTTKFGTYMKMVKLPQGPTLTFRIDNFSLMRDIRAAQRKPRTGERDYTTAPLQVLNGFSSGGNDKGERQLTAEMFRGLFPPVDVPNFKHSECRRTALFQFNKDEDNVLFRHYSVGRKQVGLQRGVSKLLRRSRLPRLSRADDVADFVLSGGVGASESEAEDEAMEAPVGGGKVGVRLTEVGPRVDMQLVKAEDGICTGAVLYHRYQTRTPSQIEVLEAKARQRKKLKARNEKLDARVQAKKTKKAKDKEKRRDDRRRQQDGEGDDGNASDSDAAAIAAQSKKRKGRGGGDDAGDRGGKKAKRFHPFGWKDKKKKSGDNAGSGDQGRKQAGNRVLDKFRNAQARK